MKLDQKQYDIHIMKRTAIVNEIKRLEDEMDMLGRWANKTIAYYKQEKLKLEKLETKI
jgi:hypothetical protein